MSTPTLSIVADNTSLPKQGRPSTLCKPLVDQFLAMNCARVMVNNARENYYMALYSFVRLNKLPIKVQRRGGELYLVRTDFDTATNTIVEILPPQR